MRACLWKKSTKKRFIRTFRQIQRNSKEFDTLKHVLQTFVKFRRNVNKTSARNTTDLTENCDNINNNFFSRCIPPPHAHMKKISRSGDTPLTLTVSLSCHIFPSTGETKASRQLTATPFMLCQLVRSRSRHTISSWNCVLFLLLGGGGLMMADKTGERANYINYINFYGLNIAKTQPL